MTEAEYLACKDPHLMLTLFMRVRHDLGRSDQYGTPVLIQATTEPQFDFYANRHFRLFGCACCQLAGRDLETVDKYEREGFTYPTLDDPHPKPIDDRTWAIGWTYCPPAGSMPENKPKLTVRADLIRDIFGNPWQFISAPLSERFESSDHVGPFPKRMGVRPAAYKTTKVADFAEAIYRDRDFESLPVLADMIEEGGCQEERLLAHLRSAGLHVRGCWALDLLLPTVEMRGAKK